MVRRDLSCVDISMYYFYLLQYGCRNNVFYGFTVGLFSPKDIAVVILSNESAGVYELTINILVF